MSDLKIFDSHLSWQKSSFGNAGTAFRLLKTHHLRQNSVPRSRQRKSGSSNASHSLLWTRYSPIGVGERWRPPRSQGAKDPRSTETAASSPHNNAAHCGALSF